MKLPLRNYPLLIANYQFSSSLCSLAAGRTARHGRVGILSRVRARPFTVKKLLLSAGIVALLWKSLS
jgi:hypothetical protein